MHPAPGAARDAVTENQTAENEPPEGELLTFGVLEDDLVSAVLAGGGKKGAEQRGFGILGTEGSWHARVRRGQTIDCRTLSRFGMRAQSPRTSK